jgi:hypothetical protein
VRSQKVRVSAILTTSVRANYRHVAKSNFLRLYNMDVHGSVYIPVGLVMNYMRRGPADIGGALV